MSQPTPTCVKPVRQPKWVLKAGTVVWVELKDGRVVDHVTKKEIDVTKGHGLNNEAHYGRANSDLGRYLQVGHQFGECVVDGFKVIYRWDAQDNVTPCWCEGKGILDTVLYGAYKGSRVRVRCETLCRWVKPRKTR